MADNQSMNLRSPNISTTDKTLFSVCHEETWAGAYFSSKNRPTTKEVARFFNKVQITKSCWLCEAPLDIKGYGRTTFRGKQILSHRFSYELFVAPIESGEYILHRRECGNKNCVNPHHLYMGTHIDNMRDLNTWGNPAIGERNGQSKLSEKDVLEIRRIYKDKQVSYEDIARLFGISWGHVGYIVRGDKWKHLPVETPEGIVLCLICRKEPAEVGGLCVGCDHLMGDVQIDRAEIQPSPGIFERRK